MSGELTTKTMYSDDVPRVDALLREKGIPHGIGELSRNLALCPGCVPELLEIFKMPLGLTMRRVVATALFARKPGASQKREALDVVLTVINQNPGRYYSELSSYVLNELTEHIERSKVHEIGRMMLDERHGHLRADFTSVLRKIGNADAIDYLLQAAKDPMTAARALRALAGLPVEGQLRLCLEALKLPGVADRDGIQGLARIHSQTAYQNEKKKVDAWLAQRGIQQGISDLYNDAKSCPDSAPELLELFKSPWSLHMRRVILEALQARRPNNAQKRELVEVILELVREHKGQYNHELSMLVLNDLANNAGADKVHEMGRMMLDEGYGELRSEFAFAFRKFRNAEAIAYLKQAAKIPQIASAALYSLAQSRAEETLELCEKALTTPGILHKDVIKETQKKLQRKLAKKKATVSHLTTEPVPDGMEEWSANLDGSDLKKVLRGIQKCVEGGFGKAEITEVRSATDDLSPESASEEEERDVARLKFDVQFNGGDHPLWLEVFCDDEDAYDLCIFGHSKLIKEMEAALGKILPE